MKLAVTATPVNELFYSTDQLRDVYILTMVHMKLLVLKE